MPNLIKKSWAVSTSKFIYCEKAIKFEKIFFWNHLATSNNLGDFLKLLRPSQIIRTLLSRIVFHFHTSRAPQMLIVIWGNWRHGCSLIIKWWNFHTNLHCVHAVCVRVKSGVLSNVRFKVRHWKYSILNYPRYGLKFLSMSFSNTAPPSRKGGNNTRCI